MTNLFDDVYACKNEQAKNNAIAAIATVLNKCLSIDEKTALKASIREAIMGIILMQAAQRRVYLVCITPQLTDAPFTHHSCQNASALSCTRNARRKSRATTCTTLQLCSTISLPITTTYFTPGGRTKIGA